MEGSPIIPIALAGDYSLNLHALATLLRPDNGFRVVSISKDTRELESNMVRGGTAEYPAVVLLDINFDLHRAAGFISFVKAAGPTIRLAALGLTRDPAAILRLLQLGGDCYIPKNSTPEQLVDALRNLVRNGNCTTPLMEQAFGSIGDDGSGPVAADGGPVAASSQPAAVGGQPVAAGSKRIELGAWPTVTAAERRFFRLAMSEASDEDIRRRMNLCSSSFTQLAAKVYRLFGVRSRDGLVLALYRKRLVIRDDL